MQEAKKTNLVLLQGIVFQNPEVVAENPILS